MPEQTNRIVKAGVEDLAALGQLGKAVAATKVGQKFALGALPSEVGVALGDKVKLKKGKTRWLIALDVKETQEGTVCVRHKRNSYAPKDLEAITGAGHEVPDAQADKHHWHSNEEIAMVLEQSGQPRYFLTPTKPTVAFSEVVPPKPPTPEDV